MVASLALIFLFGLFASALCKKIKLPGLLGMLAVGIVLGPFVLNLLDSSILSVSADLRKIALIIILIKAGLTLDLKKLKQVGRPAVLMSFLPATAEICGYVLLAPLIFGLSKAEAALMGSVLAAVSPAVVVPRMTDLIENGLGEKKGIPQMILAGASCDDVFVIVLFSSFLSMAQGNVFSAMSLLSIPISILTGVAAGIAAGLFLAFFFETAYAHKRLVRNSLKVIIILGVAFLMIAIESWVEKCFSFSGLLAVISMACAYKVKADERVSKRLSEKFAKLWLAAEVVLFVLVGAQVDIRYMFQTGLKGVLMIIIALCFRTIGVLLCQIKTDLNAKERLFCVLAYMPKATVQAAIGSAALSAGLDCGKTILCVAVLSIVLTAPLGAFAIDFSSKRLLSQ